MILHVTNTKPLPDYRLWLQFDDGTEGYADLSGELWGAIDADHGEDDAEQQAEPEARQQKTA